MLVGVLVGMLIPLLGVAGYLAWERWGGALAGDQTDAEPVDVIESVRVRIPGVRGDVETPKIIYLNREGATLTAGDDDARRNRSSIVRGANLEAITIPAFAGSPQRWNAVVECVRDRFSPFEVEVVDRRPVGRRYVMAVLGGEPSLLEGGRRDEGAHGHSHASGLAPFNGQVVEDAVVIVFSRRLRENARRTCEVVGMEVAHAYGLDHAIHCGDLMSYLRPCGRRRFRDEDLPCGEREARPCDGTDGATTQNSFRRLLTVLGPAPS
jgi:hypothetical protein